MWTAPSLKVVARLPVGVDDVATVVIGRAVDDAPLHAAAGHPDGEASWMMIATVGLVRELALTVDRAAEFPAPHDERVIEHTALLEVLNKRPTRLVDITDIAVAGRREC